MEITRYIHTGLYSKRAFSFIDRFLEKARKDNLYRKQTVGAASMTALTVERFADNEICLRVGRYKKYYYSLPGFKDWSDAKVLKHVGWELKNLVQSMLLKRHHDKKAVKNAWKRCSSEVLILNASRSEYISLAEAYFIYDLFLGRSSLERKHGKDFVEKMRGEPLDPIMTEMVIAKREEKEKLQNGLTSELRRLEDECEQKISEMSEKIYKEYAKLKDDARKANAEAINSLEKELQLFLSQVAL